jgi:hypothetical protein
MTKIDPEHILLAFHLHECKPDLGIGRIAEVVAELVRISSDLHALAMCEINRRPLHEDEKRRRKRLQERARDFAHLLDCGLEFPDVRSSAGIAVKLPTGRSNNMGGEAWNVTVAS